MSGISEDQIRAALERKMQNIARTMSNFAATVKSVDEAKKTCVLLPVDGGAEYYKVRLTPNENSTEGVIAIPKIGSIVIAARLTNKDDVFILKTAEVSKYIIKCSDSGKIELNGNSFSMVKAETLKTELDKTNAAVTAILNAITNGVPATGTPDSGAAYKASMVAIISGKQVGNFSNIKNESIKHG